MVDSKSIMSQVHELHVIYHEISVEVMKTPKDFQVAIKIEKFPPAWKDFKIYLKHQRKEMNRKEMNLEELIIQLKFEEDKHTSAKEFGYVPNSPGPDAIANSVKHGKNMKKISSNWFKLKPTDGVE